MPTPTSSRKPHPAKRAKRTGARRIQRNGLLLALLCCSVLLAVAMPRIGAAENSIRLFVYATTDIRAHALQQEMAASLPGIQVRVFGRVRELQAAVQQEAPDAVLARPVVLDTLRLQPKLRGLRRGSPREPYMLLSVGRTFKPSELGPHALGAVDLVGRNEMKSFVSQVLGVPAPKLKLVTTEHDLLPLLQFGEATAVLTSEQWVSVLKRKSNLDLRTTALANGVELPALWCISDSVRAAVEPKVKAWKPSLNSKLGVDEWK
jgi:hypothetical protein